MERMYTGGVMKSRLTQPPILWLRFGGWFVSGFSLGWLMRDPTIVAPIGPIRVAIIIAIASQLSIVMYPLFSRWCGVDPVSWRLHPLGRRNPECRKVAT